MELSESHNSYRKFGESCKLIRHPRLRMCMNDVGKMAESMVPRGVFATVINNGGNNQANSPLQTLVTTVRVPAIQEVRGIKLSCTLLSGYDEHLLEIVSDRVACCKFAVTSPPPLSLSLSLSLSFSFFLGGQYRTEAKSF